MRRFVSLTIAAAMTVAACGGSDETAPEPDVEVEAVDDDDGAFRLAGGEVRVIRGCRIEPNTRCSGVDLRRANLSGADLQGAVLEEVDLRGANLSGADLQGARGGVDLRGVNLRNANLQGATLMPPRSMIMRWGMLPPAELFGTTLCNTTMPNGSVRDDDC